MPVATLRSWVLCHTYPRQDGVSQVAVRQKHHIVVIAPAAAASFCHIRR
jgi:hypothetical protein